MPGTTTRSTSARTASQLSGAAGGVAGNAARTSPGFTSGGTGYCSTCSTYSAIQSISSWPARRNSSRGTAPHTTHEPPADEGQASDDDAEDQSLTPPTLRLAPASRTRQRVHAAAEVLVLRDVRVVDDGCRRRIRRRSRRRGRRAADGDD